MPSRQPPASGFWTGRQSLDHTSVCNQDVWEAANPGAVGHTFTRTNDLVSASGEFPLELGRRIDYLLVRCGSHGPTLDVLACERIFDLPTDGVWASDHYGVMTDSLGNRVERRDRRDVAEIGGVTGVGGRRNRA